MTLLSFNRTAPVVMMHGIASSVVKEGFPRGLLGRSLYLTSDFFIHSCNSCVFEVLNSPPLIHKLGQMISMVSIWLLQSGALSSNISALASF